MCQHPGIYIREELDKIEMSQKELATRIGVSEKLVSLIIGGARDISANFARKLGYVLKDSKYWLDAQASYEAEQQKVADKNGIGDDEVKLLKEFKIIIPYLMQEGWIHNDCGDVEKVLQLREFLQVSNLSLIPHISYNAAYRAQLSKNININPFILFAWQRLCEKEVENIHPKVEVNTNELEEYISDIKKLMSKDISTIANHLEQIFFKCGIAFKVVKNFKGAPVQGFIKSTVDKLILCVTLRGKNADRFWFTLFHEMAHILHGDYNKRFIDFDSVNSDQEEKADEWARNQLIDPVAYKNFIFDRDPTSFEEIVSFATENKVPPFIVIGRLQKDQYLEYSDFQSYIPQYQFENIN